MLTATAPAPLVLLRSFLDEHTREGLASGIFHSVTCERVRVRGTNWETKTALLIAVAWNHEEPPDGCLYAVADPDSISYPEVVWLRLPLKDPSASWRVIFLGEYPWVRAWYHSDHEVVMRGIKRACKERMEDVLSSGEAPEAPLFTIP